MTNQRDYGAFTLTEHRSDVALWWVLGHLCEYFLIRYRSAEILEHCWPGGGLGVWASGVLMKGHEGKLC